MKDTFYLKKKKKQGFGSKLLFILILLICAYAVYHYTPFFVKNPINIKDTKYPLKEINIYAYTMNTKIPLYDKIFENKNTYNFPLKFKLNQRLPDGPAKFAIEVTDYSQNNFSFGFKKKIEKQVTVYNHYPKVILLNDAANILEGGSAVVLFYANDKIGLKNVYLQVKYANNKIAKFRCFNAEKFTNHPHTYIAFFTYPFCEQKNWDTSIVAQNNAGNKIYVHVPVYYESFKNKKTDVQVDTHFIETKVYRLLKEANISFNEQDPAQAFDLVINKLEKQNNEQIAQIANSVHTDKILFKGPFLQLPGSAVMAYFGDYRTFYYDNSPLTHEYHLGVDFASIKHAKVPAANSGVVVYTGNIGVYGKCILIDHGLGIFSLYGHLEDFLVNKGEYVQKGQIIAHTDTSGLAIGDHLHFGMLIDGYYVNPIEWLDGSWIRNNIERRIADARKRADMLKYYTQ
ncbi:M23 family metallopeptidase [Desulfurella sp.]|uniref:M23 family metallopeptidase n=1 Tax=Desulfurella sp. TaxID=1962857 RepID=UPI0025B948E9|nr:M23 family metallopeptidase [Desulfurella sp.]